MTIYKVPFMSIANNMFDKQELTLHKESKNGSVGLSQKDFKEQKKVFQLSSKSTLINLVQGLYRYWSISYRTNIDYYWIVPFLDGGKLTQSYINEAQSFFAEV